MKPGRQLFKVKKQSLQGKLGCPGLAGLDENRSRVGAGINRRRAKDREQWEKTFTRTPTAGAGLFGNDLELRMSYEAVKPVGGTIE